MWAEIILNFFSFQSVKSFQYKIFIQTAYFIKPNLFILFVAGRFLELDNLGGEDGPLPLAPAALRPLRGRATVLKVVILTTRKIVLGIEFRKIRNNS